MFDRDPQERLDELTEDDLAGHRLRGLDHRPDIQLLGGRPDHHRRRRWRCFLARTRVALVELLYLAERSPACKATARILHMGACGGRGPAVEVKSGSKLVGDPFVLDEAVLTGQSN